MEIIRRKTDYALRSLSYMATFPREKRFSVKVIAKEQGVPQAFLRKIFQRLAFKKIVCAKAGVGGGFSLIKSPKAISLKDILEAVQGEFSLSDCLFEKSLCHRAKECRLRSGLSRIQKRLAGLLDKYTLKDFLSA